MKNGIITFFNVVHIALVYLAKFMMVAMVLIIFVNVVLRYVFNSGLMWSEEVALLLAVWFIFIAMSLGVKQGLHINITLIPESRQSPAVRKVLSWLKSLAALAVALTMIVHGWKLVGFTMQSIMPATQWPAGLLYAILPLSAIVIIYESLMDIFGIDTRDKAVDDFLAGVGSFKDVLGGNRG
ncbi:MAG: TRAP transporter small permease [Spirochaetes bacterium]|nr:TRAP transporter small permease [Spirochaetota bacterium]MBU0956017.1 TRAP transporter small permease [Spirochaetota bacterium]